MLPPPCIQLANCNTSEAITGKSHMKVFMTLSSMVCQIPGFKIAGINETCARFIKAHWTMPYKKYSVDDMRLIVECFNDGSVFIVVCSCLQP